MDEFEVNGNKCEKSVISGKEIFDNFDLIRKKIGLPVKVIKKGYVVQTGWIHNAEKDINGVTLWISGKRIFISNRNICNFSLVIV